MSEPRIVYTADINWSGEIDVEKAYVVKETDKRVHLESKPGAAYPNARYVDKASNRYKTLHDSEVDALTALRQKAYMTIKRDEADLIQDRRNLVRIDKAITKAKRKAVK